MSMSQRQEDWLGIRKAYVTFFQDFTISSSSIPQLWHDIQDEMPGC